MAKPKHPLTGPDDPRHGRASTYRYHGCRCDECSLAAITYQRTHRAAVRAAVQADQSAAAAADFAHGVSGYNYRGCRCDICLSAGRARQRECYRKWREANPAPTRELREVAGNRIAKRLNPVPHGTASGYRYHLCRCELCRKAHADELRDTVRAWRKANPELVAEQRARQNAKRRERTATDPEYRAHRAKVARESHQRQVAKKKEEQQ